MDLGLTISITLFSVSLAWLVYDRIHHYPFIRRFAFIHLPDSKYGDRANQYGNKRLNLFIPILSFGYLALWILITSFSFYWYQRLVGDHTILSFIALIVGPISYFLAPQFISASLSTFILLIFPEDKGVPKACMKKDEWFSFWPQNQQREIHKSNFWKTIFYTLIFIWVTPLIIFLWPKFCGLISWIVLKICS